MVHCIENFQYVNMHYAVKTHYTK